jgi:hypothetical protein
MGTGRKNIELRLIADTDINKQTRMITGALSCFNGHKPSHINGHTNLFSTITRFTSRYTNGSKSFIIIPHTREMILKITHQFRLYDDDDDDDDDDDIWDII